MGGAIPGRWSRGYLYGCSNLAKFIGPLGLAVIAGASNYVAPKATLDALAPSFRDRHAVGPAGIMPRTTAIRGSPPGA